MNRLFNILLVFLPVMTALAYIPAAQTLDVDSVDYWGSLRITKSHIGNNPRAVGLTYQFDGGYFALTPEPYRPPHSVAVGARYVPSFHYYVNDYQGNVRLVVDGNGSVEQRNDYYAYGGPWGDNAASQGVQPNKYNGKELDRMHGLDWYDYGARMYDPAMGLFTQIDPLAEQYPHLNPYQYCAGNPVKYVDPDGREVVISGPLAHMAVQQLQAIIGNKVQLNLSDENHLCPKRKIFRQKR